MKNRKGNISGEIFVKHVFIVSCIVCNVFFVLFRLCTFILICFVCTGVKDYCHRVTTQLQ
jgi:hypothetical protein